MLARLLVSIIAFEVLLYVQPISLSLVQRCVKVIRWLRQQFQIWRRLKAPTQPPPVRRQPKRGEEPDASQKTLSVKSSLPRTRAQRVSGESRGGGEKQTETSQKSIFGPGFLKFGIADGRGFCF